MQGNATTELSKRRLPRSSRALLVTGGIGLLLVSVPNTAHAAFSTAVIDWAIEELCAHIQGDLGGLLVAVAALGALVAAAMGSYRAFYSAIITAVGAFAIATILSLNFSEAAEKCKGGGGGGGGGGAGRSATVAQASSGQATRATASDTAAADDDATDPFGEVEDF